MECSSCRMEPLGIELRCGGEESLLAVREAADQLRNQGKDAVFEDNILRISEADLPGMLDFCRDHADTEAIAFRIAAGGGWRSLAEAGSIAGTKWVDDLIREERISCHIQPIVNGNGELYAYEFLARFIREDGTLIYPGEMFQAARERGRLYALDKACRMAAVRHAAPLKTRAFINFVPTAIYAPEYCLRTTVNLAAKLGADPSLLVFEVVETDKVEDTEHLKRIMAYYRERGFRCALDDTGAGYSTEELLAELSPHYMKLDMQHVQGVARDADKQRSALSFLEAALRVGAVPLAEGIEQQEDFDWLKLQGYQLFQGYLFGRPAPVDRYYPGRSDAAAAVIA